MPGSSPLSESRRRYVTGLVLGFLFLAFIFSFQPGQASMSFQEFLELKTRLHAEKDDTNGATNATVETTPATTPAPTTSPSFIPSMMTKAPTPAPPSEQPLPAQPLSSTICPASPPPIDGVYLSRPLPPIRHTTLPPQTLQKLSSSTPIQVGVLGGSYTLGIQCNKPPTFDQCPSLPHPCYPCAWPGRLQAYLDSYFGPTVFNVVNLSVSASCSGCVSPALANKLGDERIKGPLDVLIHDFSVNDANTKRENTRAAPGKDPRHTILASVEELVRRVEHCDGVLEGDRPVVWMTQGPNIGWSDKGPKSNEPVYKEVADKYSLPYIDLNSFGTTPGDDTERNAWAWPHPDSTAHSAHAALVFKYIVSVFCGSEGGEEVDVVDGPTCGGTPLTTEEERAPFKGCDTLTTYLGGAREEDWSVGKNWGPGWGLNHNDVPEREDKTGWLFEYNHANDYGDQSEITFENIVVKDGDRINIGFLRTYEKFGPISCRVDEGEEVAIDPIWDTQVSLFEWKKLPAAKGTHTVTCTADLRAESRDVTKDFKFKILGVSSC